MYESEWSGTATANLLSAGFIETPFGTAHDFKTPPISSRKSKCRREAWCSWMTNRFLINLRVFQPRLKNHS
jgi:hypothetical protein